MRSYVKMTFVSIQILIFTNFLFTQVFNEEIEDNRIATVETLVILDKNLTYRLASDYQRKKFVCDIFEKIQMYLDQPYGRKIKLSLNGLIIITEEQDQQFIEYRLYAEHEVRGNWKADVKLEPVYLNIIDSTKDAVNFLRRHMWSKDYDLIIVFTEIIFVHFLTTVGIIYYYINEYLMCNYLKVFILNPLPERVAHAVAEYVGAPIPPDASKDFLNRTSSNECLWRKDTNRTVRCPRFDCVPKSECPSFKSLMQELDLP